MEKLFYSWLSLQAALKTTEAEKDRLAEKAQNLPSVTRERDNLYQQLSAAQQQLQDTQVHLQGMYNVSEQLTWLALNRAQYPIHLAGKRVYTVCILYIHVYVHIAQRSQLLQYKCM